MATNKVLLGKGIRLLFLALPTLFVGVFVLNSAFKNEKHPFYLPVLGLSIIVCLLAVYLMYKGLRTITNAVFNDNLP